MEAYCMKCRSKREMQNPEHVTMKNGKPACKGTCPVCQAGMYCLIKEESEAQKDIGLLLGGDSLLRR